ncbi:selenide, water dikinase SelD [Salinispirillum sp. LH 10-3-1]|uniref:Selenide, water dikinase SelD n=1 Tax=Salinispirillum sp. LH 10-3-1 TaxID=2952525 RepID=A0AB38YGX9_9GAMM
MIERDLVLLGGGHTHALLIRKLAMQPIPNVRVTLISDGGTTPYSGMLPGLIAGHYDLDDILIDLNQLCRKANVRFIPGRVVGLNLSEKHVQVDGWPDIRFDRLSIDTGATPSTAIPGSTEHAVGVKPVSGLYERWQNLMTHAPTSSEPQHWAVVGAGAGGVELVLAMAHRFATGDTGTTAKSTASKPSADWHLVFSGDSILPGYPKRLQRIAQRALDNAQITCHAQFRVQQIDAEGIQAEDGRYLRLQQTLLCTPAGAPQWPADAGLDTARGGFIAVNEYLQSTSHPEVFAAGDVAEMVNDPRPKAGVYAVRQARFLHENLRRAFAGEPLQPIRLQRQFLSLLALGGKTAVGRRGPITLHGDWVWRWKDRIDRDFMALFTHRMKAMAMTAPDMSAPHCAGCGSKLGPELLADTLHRLPVHKSVHVSPALSQAEDAANWQPTPGAISLQSMDGFRAFSTDLYRFGKVSVLHALSDLYAMGAKPVLAQVWANMAFAHPRLQERDFAVLMQGIAEQLVEEATVLAGGHSTEGAETHLSLSVTGEADAAALWRKQGAQPGDVLVLTKPLGTGVILAADMSGQAPWSAMQAAWCSMLQSNRIAMTRLQSIHPHAVTDVTGFGLLGHALEMLSDDTLALQLDGHAIPALPGALELLQAGHASSLVPQLMPLLNRCSLDLPANDPRIGLLLDPQTSGGLLVALPSEATQQLVQQLPSAQIIGRFVARAADQAALVVSSS